METIFEQIRNRGMQDVLSELRAAIELEFRARIAQDPRILPTASSPLPDLPLLLHKMAKRLDSAIKLAEDYDDVTRPRQPQLPYEPQTQGVDSAPSASIIYKGKEAPFGGPESDNLLREMLEDVHAVDKD